MATVIEEVEAEFSRQPPPLNEWRTNTGFRRYDRFSTFYETVNTN
jgi:hypothetical protein